MSSLSRAAHNIVARSLGLDRNHNLLIVADDRSLEVASVMSRTAHEIDVQAAILYVPRFIQSNFGPNESLPLLIEAAIGEANAIFSCLSDDAEYMNYRSRVLRTSWTRHTRVAHVPGITLDILRMADTDYDLIRERCKILTLALVLGRQIEIISFDSHGLEHKLVVQIDGWNDAIGIGDGIISDGEWANLPPGETFIVPASGAGEVVINGSIPGRVLAPGEELILAFQQGRLVDLQPVGSPSVQHLRETQIDYAISQGDPNWSNLAEIGFGVNPSIDQLTGIELIDEKRAGTIHIALGDSEGLGGKVQSSIHCDLVIEKPTVRIDGRLLLEKGEWRANEVDWQMDFRKVQVISDWWSRIEEVGRKGVRTEVKEGRLTRRWLSGPGGWSSIEVGTEATARLAADLYNLLPDRGGAIAKDELLTRALGQNLDELTVFSLICIMDQYDLVSLRGDELDGSARKTPC